MPTVTFVKEKQTFDVPEGSNLRQEARKHGIDLYPKLHRVANCHGKGTCGTCAVVIRQGIEHLPAEGFWERLMSWLNPLTFFRKAGRNGACRLACQTKVTGDIEVETTPGLNWHGENFWS